jgi:hypothetical protein
LWVIAVIGGLLALFIFLLWVPLDFILNAEVYERPKFQLKFSWLFGLISREIPGQKRKPARGREKRRRSSIATVFKVLGTRGLPGRIKTLVKEVLSCFRFRDIVADFQVGLGDPADTGLLFAVLGPASVFLGSSHSHQINIQPSFGDDVVFEGYSRGRVRLRPVRLVPPVTKFVFSLPAARAAWAIVSGKWQRKK